MSDNTEALLLGQVQNLTSKVDELLERIPEHGRQWIGPTELSKLAGCSVRTIQNWRVAGKFRPSSVRPGGRSVLFHIDNALADLQQGGQG
jgi:hypothetical protein